jgi:hypothetical protein
MARERSRRLVQVASNTATGVQYRTMTEVEVLDDDGRPRLLMVDGALPLQPTGTPQDAALILPLIPRTTPVNNAPDRWDYDDYIRPAYDRWRRWKFARQECEDRGEAQTVVDTTRKWESDAWDHFCALLKDPTQRRPNQLA